MPFLENALKPLHDDALGKLQIYKHCLLVVTIVCTPLPFFYLGGGIEPPTKFSERGHLTYRISIFRGGLLGKKGWLFFWGGEGGVKSKT